MLICLRSNLPTNIARTKMYFTTARDKWQASTDVLASLVLCANTTRWSAKQWTELVGEYTVTRTALIQSSHYGLASRMDYLVWIFISAPNNLESHEDTAPPSPRIHTTVLPPFDCNDHVRIIPDDNRTNTTAKTTNDNEKNTKIKLTTAMPTIQINHASPDAKRCQPVTRTPVYLHCCHHNLYCHIIFIASVTYSSLHQHHHHHQQKHHQQHIHLLITTILSLATSCTTS